MAPEQLEGKEQTVKTDIYSLGLVLYELFTGKKAFEAANLGELIKLRRSTSTPTTPTSIVKDLDPLIEKVIDRCIQADPADRPASALQVAAALPGGDPIAAALAAGETPSPEMVAAAPKQGILRPAIAGALFVSFLVLLAVCAWFTKYTAIYRMTRLDQPPAALRAHARDVIRKLGYTQPPVDSADGIILKDDYLKYIAANDQSPERWEKMRAGGPGPYRFWYRQSPRYFQSYENILVDRPALDVSGMASLYLDMEGRLHWFIAVPPQREPPADLQGGNTNTAPDWSLPFREAGLDIANFKSVPSTSIPLHAYDSRAAWDGPDPEHPELNTHVEAAAFRGKLIYFETIYPWDQPLRQEQPPESGGARALTLLIIAIYLVALFGSLMLARRNLRLGRGDRRGATRVALVYFAVQIPVWLFIEHHNGLPGREFDLFFLHMATAIFTSIFLWLLYVALEPFIRRRWPAWIISWSRLLAGDFRDPLVGRDILFGAVIGAGLMFVQLFAHNLPRLMGKSSHLVFSPGSEMMGNLFFSRFSLQLMAALFQAFISVFLLLLFVVVLRRERFAVLALWLLLTVVVTLVSEANWMMVPFTALSAFLVVFTLIRYGLLAVISVVFVSHLTVFYPITTELTAWYAIDFTIALVMVVALAAFGFYTSLGGEKILTGKLLED
jgi:hypothetical protein